MSCGIIAHPDYTLHLTGQGHPECPQRYATIVKALRQERLLNSNTLLTPRVALRDELLLCHTSEYIDLVQNEVTRAKGISMLSTGDAMICPASWNIALLAAGGALTAVEAVMEGRIKTAFCAVRPPGHHAMRSCGMGFCLFNNVSIAARFAQEHYGVQRVAIIDWDVHHGNGTQDIFEDDATVFYFSVHQSPLYPGTGYSNEIGAGNVLNCPIPGGTESRVAVLQAFSDKLLPAMEQFGPELILISAGFDGHDLDPLGGWNLTDEDYISLTRMVVNIAKAYTDGRIVSVLEGGYSLKALGTVVPKHVRTLALST